MSCRTRILHTKRRLSTVQTVCSYLAAAGVGYRSCAGPSDRIGRAAQLETYNGLPFLPCIAGIASPSIYHTRIPTDPHSINIVRLHYPSRVADRGSQQDIFLPININLTRGCCAVTALQSSLQCYRTGLHNTICSGGPTLGNQSRGGFIVLCRANPTN